MRHIKKKLPVHPSFILLFVWFIACGLWQEMFIFVGVVLTHEFGHFLVAKKLGYKLDSFFLAPYGVSLNFKESTFENNDEIKIALAGPVVNLTLAFLCMALWWAVPESYNYTYIFVRQSFALALFNLLPAYPMDGGRVLLSFICKFMTREKGIRLIKIFNITFSAIFLVLFILSCQINFNPTFALASAFLLGGVIQTSFESKYRLASILKKRSKDFSRPLILYVSGSAEIGQLVKNISQNRYTIFCVDFEDKTRFIDEKIVLSLSMRYPFCTQIKEIYIKKP